MASVDIHQQTRISSEEKVLNLLLKHLEETTYLDPPNDDVDRLNSLFVANGLPELADYKEVEANEDLYFELGVEIEYHLTFEPLEDFYPVDPKFLFDITNESIFVQTEEDGDFLQKISWFNATLLSHGLKYAVVPIGNHDLKWVKYK